MKGLVNADTDSIDPIYYNCHFPGVFAWLTLLLRSSHNPLLSERRPKDAMPLLVFQRYIRGTKSEAVCSRGIFVILFGTASYGTSAELWFYIAHTTLALVFGQMLLVPGKVAQIIVSLNSLVA